MNATLSAPQDAAQATGTGLRSAPPQGQPASATRSLTVLPRIEATGDGGARIVTPSWRTSVSKWSTSATALPAASKNRRTMRSPRPALSASS